MMKLLNKVTSNPLKTAAIVIALNMAIYAALFIGGLLIIKWIFF